MEHLLPVRHVDARPARQHRCPICNQVLVAADAVCHNTLCRCPDRRISRIDAISMSTGPLRNTILRYKYQQRWGWGLIFGRLLLGHIWKTSDLWDATLIVANPTWTGAGGRPFGHTELVVQEAARWDIHSTFPFDARTPPALVLTGLPPHSAGHSYGDKFAAAVARADLTVVTRPVSGHVVLYDDVATTGWQLEFTARKLLHAGATKVTAVVLARAPYTG